MKTFFRVIAGLAGPVEDGLFVFTRSLLDNSTLRKQLIQLAREIGEGVKEVKTAWLYKKSDDAPSSEEEEAMYGRFGDFVDDLERAYKGLITDEECKDSYQPTKGP